MCVLYFFKCIGFLLCIYVEFQGAIFNDFHIYVDYCSFFPMVKSMTLDIFPHVENTHLKN